MTNTKLILLHGWGMSPQVFDPLIERLESFEIIAPRLPGYLGSQWASGFDFEQQLALMAGDLPAGRLLGWSLGGLYAIELARRYPGQFSRVDLLACNPCFVRRKDWNCALEPSVFDAFYSELNGDWQRCLRRFLSLQMQGEDEARSLLKRFVQELLVMPAVDLGVLQFGLDLLKHWDARASLAELRQPVRLILGERDALVPITLAMQITEQLPHIQVESIAGAAHVPFFSQPDTVAGLL